MNTADLFSIANGIKATISRRSPEILTGIGVAGMITTAVMAVRATPKALILLEKKKSEEGVDKLPPVEVIKATWKCYTPAVITGIVSITCLIGASSENIKRNTALATAYSLSESALKNYQEKVIETLGERKEQTIKDAIAKDAVDRNPVSDREVIITEKGNTLCFDPISGRYFKSDIDKIKKAVIETNFRLLNETYVSMNEFYYEIGLKRTDMGDDLGWSVNDGQIDMYFSSQLADDGTPCLVMGYHVGPRYDYGNR